jgi:putative copper export protein
MPYVLQVIMRFLHFSCMAVLLGGVAYWRMVLIPSTRALTEEERAQLSERDAAAFRPFVRVAVAGSVVSGIFNVLLSPGHALTHNLVLAVKLLLVLHVFASVLLAVRKGRPGRPRTLTGVLVAGAVILALSAYLKVFY